MRASRRSSSCSSASTAACCRSCRAAARSARRAISRRSRISRCRSSARARRSSRASGCPALEALARVGLEPIAPRGEGRALAHQRHAVHGGVPRARARARAAARAGRRSRVRAVARGAAGLADVVPAADPRAPSAARAGRLGGERAAAARGLRDQRGASLVRQGAGRVLASLRAAGARRVARPARLLRVHDLRRVERGDRQPARPRRGRGARLERQLPRAAARLRARRARDGGVGAREHLRASHRAAREPEPLRRAAGVPDDRRRAEQRVHDPAVRGGVARLGEQGAVAPGVGRLDPDERGPGGSCVDGQHGGAEGMAGARELRARARDRAARGRAGRRVPSRRSSRAPACRRRAARCASCRRGCATTARSRRDIEEVAIAIRGGSLVAAAEARGRERCDEHDRDARRAGRGAVRRPLAHPRAARRRS